MGKKLATITGRAKTTRGDKKVRGASTKESPLQGKSIRLGRKLKKELKVKQFDERATQQVERRIPLLAKNATNRAYRETLRSGDRVLIARAGELVEVRSDGTRYVVKKIEPPVKMRKGAIIKIK